MSRRLTRHPITEIARCEICGRSLLFDEAKMCSSCYLRMTRRYALPLFVAPVVRPPGTVFKGR